MRIALTSDIHWGNMADAGGTGPFTVTDHAHFAAEIHAAKPDVLIVTGDCGETCIDKSYLFEFCEVYKNPHGASICIPGNHDLWLNQPQPERDHWIKHDWFFAEVQRYGWIGIRGNVWQKDGVVVAGGMGWFDFSSADPMYSLTPEQWDALHPWSDYRAMKMTSSIEFNAARMEEFRASMAKVPPKDQREALIVISHFIGFPRLMADGYPRPDIGSGFMGNYEIGRMVADADADLYGCGHSHMRKEFRLGNTICINNGSGYGRGSKRFDVFDF